MVFAPFFEKREMEDEPQGPRGLGSDTSFPSSDDDDDDDDDDDGSIQ